MKTVYLIQANHGAWDDARDCPIIATPDETLAKLICEDFENNKSSIYRQMVKNTLEIEDISDVSLSYTVVPLVESMEEGEDNSSKPGLPEAYPFGPDDGNIFTRITQIEALLENPTDEYSAKEVRELERELSWIQFVAGMWDSLANVPYDKETECIKVAWNRFPADTYRPEIWAWFEEKFGVKLEQFA